MKSAVVLFGTESGNAEMIADDITAALTDADYTAQAVDMADFPVARLVEHGLVVLVSSTYGEGELPETAAPFHDALNETAPDLSATRFAAFGLGDSTYETFNAGIATLVRSISQLGATQIGTTGQHDAAGGTAPTDAATAWIEEVIKQV